MAKVRVYPSTRYSIASDKPAASPKYCTKAYYELDRHSQQVPDFKNGVEVDDSLLDGDECIVASKLP